ncbi:MAG: glycoside hydrolase 43 family protein [Kiritimatiellae bacterium]|nr:glycoside hydrolase 43 family protein [Kiritimatiellia bacterium]
MKNLLAACFLYVGVALNGATYVNPVLHLDFSDPDVCTTPDGKFIMTASSFGALPGLPLLESADMVNWRYVAHALEKHPFSTVSPEHGKGVWAPAILYRNGRYVIYWGDPDRGIYRISAPAVEGPWSEPRLVLAGKGYIEPCPLYDDDGRVYLVHAFAASRAKMNSVLAVCELDADETAPISQEVLVYDGIADGNFTAEGPKFYKKDGEYWLFFPAGGVEEGWQVAARSKSPFGPFAARTVLRQGKTGINGPHQGAWVRTADGEDWFLHFSDRGAYGRIVYLEPMTWDGEGWPVIGNGGEPVEEWTMPSCAVRGQEESPQTSDTFDTPQIGLQWQMLGKSAQQTLFATPCGFARLYSTPLAAAGKGSFGKRTNFWRTPNVVVQKFPAPSFSATMKARICAKADGEEAGLAVHGLDWARLGLKAVGDSFDVVYTECFDAENGGGEKSRVLGRIQAAIVSAGIRSVKASDIWLKVEVKEKNSRPVCVFSWSLDGEAWNACPGTFIARQGKWIGATMGFYAVMAPECIDCGWIDVDSFMVE